MTQDTIAEAVERILTDWEDHALDRDRRDPIRAQIMREAATIRATLRALAAKLEAAEAKCDAVMKDRAFILAERDRTFAVMLDRVNELEGALEKIASDAEAQQHFYDRNGPQWTSPYGNEYEDTSAFLESHNSIAGIARAAIKTGDDNE